MKPIDEIFDIFKIYMEENLPIYLTAASIAQFDKYLVGPPSDVDKKQLAIYLGTGNHTPANSAEDFMLQAQLPTVLDPIGYRVAIDKALVAFDASDVHANFLSFAVGAYYPGEVKDGGMSSFVVYEITFSDELTDCRTTENY